MSDGERIISKAVQVVGMEDVAKFAEETAHGSDFCCDTCHQDASEESIIRAELANF